MIVEEQYESWHSANLKTPPPCFKYILLYIPGRGLLHDMGTLHLLHPRCCDRSLRGTGVGMAASSCGTRQVKCQVLTSVCRTIISGTRAKSKTKVTALGATLAAKWLQERLSRQLTTSIPQNLKTQARTNYPNFSGPHWLHPQSQTSAKQSKAGNWIQRSERRDALRLAKRWLPHKKLDTLDMQACSLQPLALASNEDINKYDSLGNITAAKTNRL